MCFFYLILRPSSNILYVGLGETSSREIRNVSRKGGPGLGCKDLHLVGGESVPEETENSQNGRGL